MFPILSIINNELYKFLTATVSYPYNFPCTKNWLINTYENQQKTFSLIMAWRFLKRSYNRMFLTKHPKPPYTSHIVQIGDPVLRNKALHVKPENINTTELQNVRTFGKHF